MRARCLTRPVQPMQFKPETGGPMGTRAVLCPTATIRLPVTFFRQNHLMIRFLVPAGILVLALQTSGCALLSTTAAVATTTVGVATTAGSMAVSGASSAVSLSAGAVKAGARAISPADARKIDPPQR